MKTLTSVMLRSSKNSLCMAATASRATMSLTSTKNTEASPSTSESGLMPASERAESILPEADLRLTTPSPTRHIREIPSCGLSRLVTPIHDSGLPDRMSQTTVPGLPGSKVSFILIAMPADMAGRTVGAYRTFAPFSASSRAAP